MKKRSIFLPFVTLALAIGLVACGGNNAQSQSQSGGGNSSQPSSSIPAKPKITVAAADNKTTLEIGESVQLSAKEGDAALDGVTWTSSEATVASVSDAGLVTALKKGETTITAKKDGYTAGSLTIKVNGQEIEVQVESGTSEGNVITFKDSHNVDTQMVDAWSQNAVLTLEFNAAKAGNYELHVTCRAHGGYQSTNTDVFAEAMEIKINDVAVTLSGQAEGGTFTDYKLADVTLIAGKNTMTVKNLAADGDDGSSSIPTIDLFQFVPKA